MIKILKKKKRAKTPTTPSEHLPVFTSVFLSKLTLFCPCSHKIQIDHSSRTCQNLFDKFLLLLLLSAATRWDSGSRVQGAADAAAAGAGATQRLPEQDQDPHRHAAREGGEGPGAESVHPPSPAGAEGGCPTQQAHFQHRKVFCMFLRFPMATRKAKRVATISPWFAKLRKNNRKKKGISLSTSLIDFGSFCDFCTLLWHFGCGCWKFFYVMCVKLHLLYMLGFDKSSKKHSDKAVLLPYTKKENTCSYVKVSHF